MSADPVRIRQELLIFAILSIALLGDIALPTRSHVPLIVYNASGSAPIGWYRIENRPPSRGDTVLIQPSNTLQLLFANHAVLPPGVPLLKRVIALGGDRVCRTGRVVLVDGEAIAEALDRDQNGRPLPVWEGCFTLFDGQFFVVQPHSYSLDSRYFGPVSECQIIGVAHAILTWNPDG
jgi:conjugative transfer signal peptidase TraF